MLIRPTNNNVISHDGAPLEYTDLPSRILSKQKTHIIMAYKKRTFTKPELSKYDGDAEDKMYIAYNGVVYDVSECGKWRLGIHENLHFPGQDLTQELPEAPHEEEVFSHPCVKRVGLLSQ